MEHTERSTTAGGKRGIMKTNIKEQLNAFCKDRDQDGVLQDALEHLVDIEEISFMDGKPYWRSCGETLGDLGDLSEEKS